MKDGELVRVAERFFSDAIGTVVPGATLLVGLNYLVLNSAALEALVPSSASKGLLGSAMMVAAWYAVGHALTSAGQKLVMPFIGWVFKKEGIGARMQHIADGAAFREFVAAYRRSRLGARGEIGDGGDQLHTWRNLALSEVDLDQASLVRQFMFIALFNLGMGTALSILILIHSLFWLASILGVVVPATRPISGWAVAGLVLLVTLFFERHLDFHNRTMRVPFTMALKKIVPSQPAAAD